MSRIARSISMIDRARLGFILVPLAVLTACGGDNLFENPGGVSGDRRLPTVLIESPEAMQRVAVGDSVLVEVRVQDNRGVEAVELSGFALRGSAELGTQTVVPRYETKTVSLEHVGYEVRDTTLVRYLLAAADSVSDEDVYIVARARDLGGNESADTVIVAIGGPRVRITSPTSSSDVRAGSDLKVSVTAGDPGNRIQSLRITLTEALTRDTVLTYDTPVVRVDTTITFPIPMEQQPGTIRLQATARNSVNETAASPSIVLNLLPPIQDTRAPEVRFTVAAPVRAEQHDSVSVTVSAIDDTRVDHVGVTLIPTHRRAGGTDQLTTYSATQATDSATFRVSLRDLGVPTPVDTSTLRLEVTAFAVDTAGNCGTATVPNTRMSEGCSATQPIQGVRTGARYDVQVVRGYTLRLTPDDRIADIAANSSTLFLSNISRNRLEVLPIGGTAFGSPISVGSRPWGLAFNRDKSLLYVANSGGTNVSVVQPSGGVEVERIYTPNIKLYDVAFDAKTVPDPSPDAAEGDSISALFPSSVVRYDYSDRPQYIGVTQNQNLIFSTVPTAAASDGTVRVWRRDQGRLEMVTEYAEERIGAKVVIANADSAFLVDASPDNLLRVCPRNRSINPSLDRQLPVQCYTGPVDQVQDTIAQVGYDTQFLYSINIEEIGLSDTTFVAVSGDHSTVAFGEGARTNGRVMAFEDPIGNVNGPMSRFGEVRDLVGNTAERITGLSLNADGSLGMARGSEAFFFHRDLRLQGVVETEEGGGGVDMHPDNPSTRRAFVSGTTPEGLAFIDVMDTFHFRRVARIFLRDPVIGPIRAVRASGGLKIYAVTEGGVVAVDVYANDL